MREHDPVHKRLRSFFHSRIRPLYNNGQRRQRRFCKNALTLTDYLNPQSVVGGRFVRLGSRFDGGYVMISPTQSAAVAYSLGIGGNIDWDRDMADLGYKVFQYDHTVQDPAPEDSRMVFSRIGVGGVEQSSAMLKTLDALIRENGHKGRSDLVLKMDVEGFEWPVFSTIDDETLSQFTQIVVELHGLLRLGSKPVWRRVEMALGNLTRHHVPIHVHANNWASTVYLNGRQFPDVLEVTLLRKDHATFAPNNRLFPTELDAPNNPNASEIPLGLFHRAEFQD